MGGSESTDNYTPFLQLKKIQDNYNVLKTINDPILGQLKYLENKASKNTYGLISTTPKYEIDEYYIANFKKHANLQNEHVASLKQMNHKKEDAICGSFNKILILFQYYENNLAKDFASRSVTEHHYTEAEIWNIIDSVVSGGFYLQQNGLPHQDICPQNIKLTRNGFVKISEYNLIQQGLTGYFRLYSQQTKDCYLSPQLFNKLKKRELKPKVNKYKADVYSMGMVILEAATLKDIRNCYNYANGVMNQDEINRRIQNVKEMYSDFLADYLTQILVHKILLIFKNKKWKSKRDWHKLKQWKVVKNLQVQQKHQLDKILDRVNLQHRERRDQKLKEIKYQQKRRHKDKQKWIISKRKWFKQLFCFMSFIAYQTRIKIKVSKITIINNLKTTNVKERSQSNKRGIERNRENFWIKRRKKIDALKTQKSSLRRQ